MMNWTKTLIIAWAVAIGIGQAKADEIPSWKRQQLATECWQQEQLNLVGEATNSHEFAALTVAGSHQIMAAMENCIIKHNAEQSIIALLPMMEVMLHQGMQQIQNQPLIEFGTAVKNNPNVLRLMAQE